MTEKNLLVTGGTGMVGKAIQSIYGNTGAVYLGSLDCDLTNFERTCMALEHYKPTHIIHLAAKVGGVQGNTTYVGDFCAINQQINSNLLRAAYELESCERVVSLLSTCVYPDEACVTYPLTEDQLHAGPPHDSNFGYAYAKRMIEVQSRSYNQQLGRSKFLCAIPNNIYGKCFSSDTEVLTPRGITNIKQLKVGDSIYSLNPNTFKVEIANVINTTCFDSKESYHFSSSVTDFIVTPEHKMFFRQNNKFGKKPASYFENKCGKQYGQITLAHHLPFVETKSSNVIDLKKYADDKHLDLAKNDSTRDHKSSSSKFFPLECDSLDFAEFLGWFISKGSMNCHLTKGGKQSFPNMETGQICLSQCPNKNKSNHEKIKNLLSRMRIPFGCHEKNLYFTSRLFRNYINEEIGNGSENKKIPSRFLQHGSHKERLILYETLMAGDGNKNRNRYSTKSKQLSEDFVHLCFLLGIKVGKVTEDSGCYRISIRQTKQNPTVKYKNIKHNESELYQQYYCVTVEKNNIIYAGRNSKLNWIGQCDNFDLDNGHVVPSMIRKIYEARESKQTFVEMWGDGRPCREFTYAPDIARDLLLLTFGLKEGSKHSVYNIGNVMEEMSIADVVAKVCDCLGWHGEVKWNTNKPSGQLRKPSKTLRFMSEFPMATNTTFDDGLKETCKWFVDNYPNIRRIQ